MKTKFCFYSQLNYSHPRTAIEAEILFAARVMHLRVLGAFIKPVHPCTGLIARFAQQNALLLRTTDIRVGTEKKTPRKQNSSGKKIEAESAVLHFVFFEVIVNKMQQSAKERCLLKRNTLPEVFPLTTGSGKTRPFEKRHAGCEEREKINRRRIYDTLRINFFEATKQTACIFSKGEETGVNYYGARYLDPKYSRWLSGDPALSDYIPKAPIDDEAKKHNENLPGMGGVFNVVNLHLYHYAGNNPVKYTDPDGEHIEVFDNNDGTYTICGGTINSDLSIYLTVDGQRTGGVLGTMFTEYSFFNNDTVVAGAMIDMNDTSGQAFLDDFKTNTPSLISYIPNGGNGKKYDFKDIGNDGRQGNDLVTYHHRGMQLGTTQGGNRRFGSARDVGNYAAGYAAGKNGLSWSLTRLGFDGFQSKTSGKLVQEGPESQAAQIKGFADGSAYWKQMMQKCAEDH